MERLETLLASFFILTCLSVARANVISLGNMIEWLDPKLKSVFAAYGRFNGYGCYCGIGGSGVPLDEVDCCCQAHDACYVRLADEGTCSVDGTFSHLYTFKKLRKNGKPAIECKPSPEDKCAEELCQCDLELAYCFTKNEPKYDHKHKNIDRKAKCDREKWLKADFCIY